jgi:putative ABC transport system permease protein
MGADKISMVGMLLAYLLLLVPLGILMWQRVPIVGRVLVAVVRMTFQLLLVGLYLQFVFKQDNGWLNGLWVLVMVTVADVSIVRSCDLRLRVFAAPLLPALLLGTAIPLLWLVGAVLHRPNLLEAQYLIPIGGMILGNCLRANIIGLKTFYQSIRRDEKHFNLVLVQGASLREATQPYLSEAFQAAVSPTIATMMTIGLVSLPGMMTGVIMGGNDPMLAIKYQIGIMIAIFSGTAITLPTAIIFTLRRSFSGYGILRSGIFVNTGKGGTRRR